MISLFRNFYNSNWRKIFIILPLYRKTFIRLMKIKLFSRCQNGIGKVTKTGVKHMTKQTELMLVEELSEQELEAISGGGLINISDNDVDILNNSLNKNDVDVDVDVL